MGRDRDQRSAKITPVIRMIPCESSDQLLESVLLQQPMCNKLLSRGFSLTDVGPFAYHLLTAWADPDGIHARWRKHTNIGIGDEFLAVAAVSHEQQSIHSRT